MPAEKKELKGMTLKEEIQIGLIEAAQRDHYTYTNYGYMADYVIGLLELRPTPERKEDWEKELKHIKIKSGDSFFYFHEVVGRETCDLVINFIRSHFSLPRDIVLPEKLIRKNQQLVCDKENGDCFRACLTSILGVENSQSLGMIGKDWFVEAIRFLREFGCMIHYEEKAIWRDGYWIASVPSLNFKNTSHSIIMHEQEVFFDPSPHNKYGIRENLLGKNIVTGGSYLEVTDISKLYAKAIDFCQQALDRAKGKP